MPDSHPLPSFLRPLRRFIPRRTRRSHAQGAEDLLIEDALAAAGCTETTYLDVGAFDAFNLSNTYYFYRKGWRGVLVEANPVLARGLRLDRPGDTVLNCGVGPTPVGALDFCVMSSPTLSTFDRAHADHLQQTGTARIAEVVSLPVRTLAEIAAVEFPSRSPAFLTLDIEGVDLEVVRATDWRRLRPAAVCVETREYRTDGEGRRISEIHAPLLAADYLVFAETYHNTILVDARRMERPRNAAAPRTAGGD